MASPANHAGDARRPVGAAPTTNSVSSVTPVVGLLARLRQILCRPEASTGRPAAARRRRHGASSAHIAACVQSLEPRIVLSGATLDLRAKGQPAPSPAASGILDEAIAADNNNFASRRVVSGSAITVTGNNIDATKETGEKNHGYATTNPPATTGGRSVWWSWRASSSGTVTIDTVGSTFDTLLGVYTGTSVSFLTSVAQNDDINVSSSVYTSRVTFNAMAGTTYQIAVDGYAAESGNITLNINLAVANAPLSPTNLTATPVSSGQINLAWTDRSTNETGFKIERATSLTGTWTQIATVGANVTSYSNTGLTGGTTYYYRVRSHTATATSGASNEIGATTFAAPGNNNFASAAMLTGALVTANGTNLYATKEIGEPSHGFETGGASVWWKWTASASAEVEIDTFGSNFDTLLGVYTGASVAGLTSRASNDDAATGGVQSKVTFNAVQGTTYYIAVDGYGGAMGSIVLHINLKAPQPPAAPTSLTAAAVSSSQINLAWTDNSTDEIGFKIERKTGINGVWTQIATVGANVRSFSNTGLTANTTYYYRVRSYNTPGNSAYTNEAVQTTFATGPVNNMFANRTSLSGTSITATGTNTGANKEAGEPNHFGNIGGKSVWWTWTASSSGSVQIDTIGSSFDTTLGVYTGSNVAALSQVASDDDSGGGVGTSRVTFNAVGGTTYQIAVDGYNGASGNITLHIIATAAAVPTAPSNLNGTVASTSQINLTWTDNSGTETGFKIERKTGVGGTWSQIATVGANVTSYSNTGLMANTTYYYRVRAYNATGDSAYSAEINRTTSASTGPANNNFASRQQISGTSITTTGSNVNATKESGEPNHGGNTGGKSVWWTWTATQTGTVTIDTVGSSFDTLLGVYTGSSVGALTTIASNDDSGGGTTSSVTFSATSGTTYQIAVDGYNAASGNITLHLSQTAAPPTGGFSITLQLTGFTTGQQAIFQQAANRWAQIITGDLPDAVYNGMTVDDLLIAGSASAIDGVGNILGQAGWRERRTTGTLLPYYGEMKFDSADMANMESNGTLYAVILHEMGHVLGIGTMWTVKGLLTGAGGTNPRFTGTQATAAYNQIFGTSFTSVPVQGNDMAVGSRDSHWRESIFATELMTPQIGGSSNPISRITVGSLADIGYTVNFNAADAYSAPTGGAIVAGDSGATGSGFPGVFNNGFSPLVLPLPTLASSGTTSSLVTPPVNVGNLINGALDRIRDQVGSTPLGPTIVSGMEDLAQLLSQPASPQTPAPFVTFSQEFIASILAALSHNLPWLDGDQA